MFVSVGQRPVTFRCPDDETAFFRWRLRRRLTALGFDRVEIVPFDFLHPSIPAPLISLVGKLGAVAERVPLVRELSGSLHITARRADR